MTDVVRGDFAFDVGSGTAVAAGVMQGKPQYLDPEISGEGSKVLLSSGKEISYSAPPQDLPMPRWENIEHLKKYFGRREHVIFPCWLYHPVLPAVVAKDARVAFEQYGVRLHESTDEERAMYGAGKYRWAFTTEWRTVPYPNTTRHASDQSAATKNVQTARADPISDLAKVLVQNSSGGLSASEVEEFRQFQAWKAQSQAVRQDGAQAAQQQPHLPESQEADRRYWLDRARKENIKVAPSADLATIKRVVQEELERRVAKAHGNGNK